VRIALPWAVMHIAKLVRIRAAPSGLPHEFVR
jgi:hypothetical protein